MCLFLIIVKIFAKTNEFFCKNWRNRFAIILIKYSPPLSIIETLRFNYSHLLDYTVCINKFEKKKTPKTPHKNHKTTKPHQMSWIFKYLGDAIDARPNRSLERPPVPTVDQINSQRAQVGCNVCADKGERTADNKKVSGTHAPMHSLDPRFDQAILENANKLDKNRMIFFEQNDENNQNDEKKVEQIDTLNLSHNLSLNSVPSLPTQTPLNHDHLSTQSNPSCECLAYQNSTCPLNRRELGRASWAFLHTLAATYPEKPTKKEQDRMSKFVFDFAELYPCGYCADYTRNEMIRRPPVVTTRKEFQYWMCGVHNEVNFRMGKPLFNCEYIEERWLTGPPDGSCGETSL